METNYEMKLPSGLPSGLPDGLVSLSEFPGYAVSREGDVWRTCELKAGRYAGRGPERLKPSIHPRGQQWYVHVYDVHKKRVRIAIPKLVKMAFGD